MLSKNAKLPGRSAADRLLNFQAGNYLANCHFAAQYSAKVDKRYHVWQNQQLTSVWKNFTLFPDISKKGKKKRGGVQTKTYQLHYGMPSLFFNFDDYILVSIPVKPGERGNVKPVGNSFSLWKPDYCHFTFDQMGTTPGSND